MGPALAVYSSWLSPAPRLTAGATRPASPAPRLTAGAMRPASPTLRHLLRRGLRGPQLSEAERRSMAATNAGGASGFSAAANAEGGEGIAPIARSHGSEDGCGPAHVVRRGLGRGHDAGWSGSW